MLTRRLIEEKAMELGFAGIGICDGSPFTKNAEILHERRENYDWAHKLGLDLSAGTNPCAVLLGQNRSLFCYTIIFSKAFPRRWKIILAAAI